MSEMSQLLSRAFAEVQPSAVTDTLRAEFLDVDTGTYSKIINGKQSLTEARAAKWAARFYPSDPARQERFIEIATGYGRTATVEEFCQTMIDRGGWIHAVHVSELFDALLMEAGDNQLICCEYRDLPRAGEAARYEAVGKHLARAIARGLNFAMFQPFVGTLPTNSDPAKLSEADMYMQKMLMECRRVYRKFLSEAKEAAREMDVEEASIDNRLRLYERNPKLKNPYIGSGFQAKMFYIYYKSGQTVLNHYRIIQWVATPKQDLLVYRAQEDIEPRALRETFYPVPHYFERKNALPPLVTQQDTVDVMKEIQESGEEMFAWKSCTP